MAAWLIPAAAVRAGEATAAPAPGTAMIPVGAGAIGEVPPSALPLPAVAMPSTPYVESSARRFESVFFISLPFTSLYSIVLAAGAGFALEGRKFTLDTRIMIPAVSMAVLAAGWIGWTDHRATAPAP